MVESYVCGPQPINKVFDLLQFVMRDDNCPFEFIGFMISVFENSKLTYSIIADGKPPPTIVPITFTQEKFVLTEALNTLDQA